MAVYLTGTWGSAQSDPDRALRALDAALTAFSGHNVARLGFGISTSEAVPKGYVGFWYIETADVDSEHGPWLEGWRCAAIHARVTLRGLLVEAWLLPDCHAGTAGYLDSLWAALKAEGLTLGAVEPPKRQGAPKMEERADWPAKCEAVRKWQRLRQKGQLSAGAAAVVGVSEDALEHTAKRMRELGML